VVSEVDNYVTNKIGSNKGGLTEVTQKYQKLSILF
jgi:hypothetical protein